MMRSTSMIDHAQPKKGRPLINEAAHLTTIRAISIEAPRIFEMVLPATNLDQVVKTLKRKSPARRLVSL